MLIERISVKTLIMAIIGMIALVSTILSIFAGGYFRDAALAAQSTSLARVIEVAAHESLKIVSKHNFELGMKLGHHPQLLTYLKQRDGELPSGLFELLDDPLVNGFPGYSDIHLVKLRLYTLDLEFIAQSSAGITGLAPHLPAFMAAEISKRNRQQRLGAIDTLWLSPHGHYSPP